MNLNARTGCEQSKLDDMSNYRPGFEDEDVESVSSFFLRQCDIQKTVLNLFFLFDSKREDHTKYFCSLLPILQYLH